MPKGIHSNYPSGKNHYNWKGGKPFCICGKQIDRRSKRCNKCKPRRKDFHHSEETILKIGTANKGKKRTPEQIKKFIGVSAGDKNGMWNGGIYTTKDGYICLYIPEHPNSNKRKICLAHRYCAEAYLGRFLEPEEVIHHIDEDKSNNLPENLYVFESNSKHTVYHAALKYKFCSPITKSNLFGPDNEYPKLPPYKIVKN